MKHWTLFLGADHGGFHIKESLKLWLQRDLAGKSEVMVSLEDCGATEYLPDDDYPVFGQKVAEKISDSAASVARNPQMWGILICRSGGGMAIIANRYDGVRAVVCRNERDVIHAREHNNANVIVLEGDYVQEAQARNLVELFLHTSFEKSENTRHVKRLQLLDRLTRE